MLQQIQECFLPCLINIITGIYVYCKISKTSINFKDWKLYLFGFLIVIANIFNFMYMDNFIRILISSFILCVGFYFIFKENLRLIVISVLLEQLIMFISEIIYVLGVVSLLHVGGLSIVNNYFGTLLTNLIISVIAVIIINFKLVKTVCWNIVKYVEHFSKEKIIIGTIAITFTINILLFFIYYEVNTLSVLLLDSIFLIIYGIILYRTLVEKQYSLKIQAENKALVDNLNEYENLLDYQRVANHENKNQLLVVQSMLSKKDKKISEYIEEIVKDKREDNETLFTEAKRIPSGGLQGIVYQKMLKMNDKSIKVDLNVSKNIKKLKIATMNSKLNYDLCRILGVLLDNAIEATEELEEKAIGISMYNDDGLLCIEISNCFGEAPDLERMDEKGYTTKGNGHGYGLSLVKEILEKNSCIQNQRMITQDVFTQIIQVKL